ncbi:unnamed protein product [Lepeophtheirus salmonis]|uniref:(salmon louse) hypothetical protein n=1 Tax=Lepeophtheirus salmonis TaxID=72036 RepID=A0A7R8CU58_LEPSM|nr:unnamed protein product [Lepeophtheirus salmonis]CAF2895443.1 unnamed protein product [Lepeophtheirus salmonis]
MPRKLQHSSPIFKNQNPFSLREDSRASSFRVATTDEDPKRFCYQVLEYGPDSLSALICSDDRFARQNRYGPPSGFPLTSTWPGIVHHLSGPNVYALTSLHETRIIPAFAFTTPLGLVTPNDSHTC